MPKTDQPAPDPAETTPITAVQLPAKAVSSAVIAVALVITGLLVALIISVSSGSPSSKVTTGQSTSTTTSTAVKLSPALSTVELREYVASLQHPVLWLGALGPQGGEIRINENATSFFEMAYLIGSTKLIQQEYSPTDPKVSILVDTQIQRSRSQFNTLLARVDSHGAQTETLKDGLLIILPPEDVVKHDGANALHQFFVADKAYNLFGVVNSIIPAKNYAGLAEFARNTGLLLP